MQTRRGLFKCNLQNSRLWTSNGSRNNSVVHIEVQFKTTSGKNDIQQQTVAGYYGDSKRRLPDIHNSEKLLGWLSKVNLQDGLESMWKELTKS